MPAMPKEGTLERVFLDKAIECPSGVTYLDFIGTGINEENIDQIVQNLRYCMYESEEDDQIRFDS